MAKTRTFKCALCGAEFSSTGTHARWCPVCRREEERKLDAIWASDRAAREKLRRERMQRLSERKKRLKARDEEYARLGVPVTTRVASNGMVVETRGQPCISGRCGIASAMCSAIARRHL